jgi:hypothetical protein
MALAIVVLACAAGARDLRPCGHLPADWTRPIGTVGDFVLLLSWAIRVSQVDDAHDLTGLCGPFDGLPGSYPTVLRTVSTNAR